MTHVIIGIDIGGTKSAVVLARADGEILQRLSEPTRPDLRGPEATLERLAAMVREVMAAGRVMADEVRGVGVSCGGPLDTQSGVVYAPPNLPGWEAVPVKQILEDALGMPVSVENDANATALAEWRFGAGQGARNLIFMTVGTGIG
ncbi:MAG TPA: ROK family protein, partial [Chthonomonadaceae bacterium]|nr:ROK family protein [Chthonomonadaceae bacterium]